MAPVQLFILAILAVGVKCQVVTPGICPVAPAMPNFNLSRYAGRWYLQEKFWTAFEATASCSAVDYAPDFGTQIYQIDGVTKTVFYNVGRTRFTTNDGAANVQLDLLVQQTPVPLIMDWPYQILATDYYTYTVKYSCFQLGALRSEVAWILSKTRKWLPEARLQVRRVMQGYGINIGNLIPTARSLGAPCPW